MPDLLNGTIRPGNVLDQTVGLNGVPDDYCAVAPTAKHSKCSSALKTAGQSGPTPFTRPTSTGPNESLPQTQEKHAYR